MKKLKIIAIIICLLACICTFSSCYLYNIDNYDYIAKYKAPICNTDLHIFESDTCSECESNILKSGVMYKIGEDYDYDIDTSDNKIKFGDYFSDYSEYLSLYNKVIGCSLIWLVSFILTIVMLIIGLIIMIKHLREIKKV